MASALHICLYNPDSTLPLGKPFEEINQVFIVGQSSTWGELKDWIIHAGVDLVVVNLDSPDSFDIIAHMVAAYPTCGTIGISQNSDPITIIKAMRAGCNQFVPWPVDVQDLQSAVDRIKTAQEVRVWDSKRICLVGSSGGAGVTTIACNLAMELAHLTNQRCALVDLNLELGDIGCVFDSRPKYSVADVCNDTVEIDSIMLGKAFHELPCNVSILTRPENPKDTYTVTPDGVANMLTVAKQLFPFILVDLPRSFSFLSATALHDTDKLIIVTQLGVSFIRNATRIYENLCQMGAPEENIEIVLNRCKSDFSNISPDDVESHFGKPIFGMIPNDYRRVQASLDHGHPIITDDLNSPARLALYKMARKIVGDRLHGDQLAEYESRTRNVPRGILSRLWNRTPQTSITTE